MIRRLLTLRLRRITDPIDCIELGNELGDGWFICPMPRRKENPR